MAADIEAGVDISLQLPVGLAFALAELAKRAYVEDLIRFSAGKREAQDMLAGLQALRCAQEAGVVVR